MPSRSPMRLLLVAFALLLALPAFACAPTPVSVDVTFVVTPPLDTPPGATVQVVGDAPLQSLALALQADGSWSGTAKVEEGLTVTYALTLVTPAAHEVDANGVRVTRTLVVGKPPTQRVELSPVGWKRDLLTVTFEVTVTAPIATTDKLYLLGSVTALGKWRADAVPLQKRADGVWTADVTGIPASITVEWNVSRGSDSTVERDSSGRAPTRRFFLGTESRIERGVVTRWADQPPPTDNVVGDFRIHPNVASQFVGARNVAVWLPAGYATDTTRRYPVLYMHDGQNLFDAATAFAGEWRVDETATNLIAMGDVEPVVIVGVWNTPDRIADYTPVVDGEYGGGGAAKYGRFLVEELKPFIDATYRTKTTAADTGVCGSSLGGLVSLWLGLSYPGTFGRVGAVSPSVWWSNRAIVTHVSELASKPALRIWEDMGTSESPGAIGEARALRDALVARGWVVDQDLRYLEYEGAGHNESAWAGRFGAILKWLYPALL